MAKNVENRVENEGTEAKRQRYLGEALEWRLQAALRKIGYDLVGVNIKISYAEVLVVIKTAATAEGPMVGFMGGKSLASALRKAIQAIEKDKLTFKPDKWLLERFDKSEDIW